MNNIGMNMTKLFIVGEGQVSWRGVIIQVCISWVGFCRVR